MDRCGWRRCAAKVVDGLLIAVPTAALGWAAVPVVQQVVQVQARRVGLRTRKRIVESGLDTDVLEATARDSVVTMAKTVSSFMMAMLLVALALWLVYEWLAHAAFGRTVGKAVFGLRVVSVSGYGRAGLVRTLVRSLVLLGLPIVLFAYAWAYSLAERTDRPLAYQVGSGVAALGPMLMALPGNRALHDWLSLSRVESTR
ncbi:RDD family protein [Yinghuangia sp. YIM S09857]|uniref:RDD family protein n=1 Tax=Yinghuangia sp. YIM S09857 TaxID=3436929 RepID=UPI003F53A867